MLYIVDINRIHTYVKKVKEIIKILLTLYEQVHIIILMEIK